MWSFTICAPHQTLLGRDGQGRVTNAYKTRNPEMKRTLQGNIRTNPQEIECEYEDWIIFTQDRF
jgi:hypothetical protein